MTDGGSIFAAGDAAGKVNLRVDWEEVARTYALGDPILDIRISSNMLVAILCEKDLYLFSDDGKPGSLFQGPPKKLSIDKPMSCCFVNENESRSVFMVSN
jgi:hypothetical protein